MPKESPKELSELEGNVSLRIYFALVAMRSADDVCRCNQNALAQYAGININSVREALKQLVLAGWLEWQYEEAHNFDVFIGWKVNLSPILGLRVPYPGGK